MTKEPGEPKKSIIDQLEDLETMTIGKRAAESSLHLLMATLGDAESEAIMDLEKKSNIPDTGGINKKKAIATMLKALKDTLEYLEPNEQEFARSIIRTAELYVAGS